MARKKGNRGGDSVWDNYYAPYLNGGKSNGTISQQVATEQMYVSQLTELCANRFEWTGLPDSISPRFLELLLFQYGLAVYYEEPKIGKQIAIRAAQVGLPNYQGDPVEFQVIAPGVDNIYKTLSNSKCVPIWANYLRTPEHDKVMLYARKLANIDRTIEINIENMRYTKVLMVEEDQRQSYVNLMRMHQEGQPMIFGSKGLDLSQIQALDVGVPVEAVPNLMIAKSKLWNECMSMLGINNANQDKRERLVASEVSANDEQVSAFKNIALNSRQESAKNINAMFGTDISVDFKKDDMLESYIDEDGDIPGIENEPSKPKEIE